MRKRGLAAQELKSIAVFAMLVDHIAWTVVPTGTVWGVMLHMFGRLAMPVMCYFVAEGYRQTRSVPKYALRLGIFAAISYVPFILYKTGALPNSGSYLYLNAIYTLMLGLLALWAYDRLQPGSAKLLCILGLCGLSLTADWGVYGVYFILAFGIHHRDFRKQTLWFSVIAGVMLCCGALSNFYVYYTAPGTLSLQRAVASFIMQLGLFPAIPLLRLYNGQRGTGWKWGFYVFYPSHLLVLGIIKRIFLQ